MIVQNFSKIISPLLKYECINTAFIKPHITAHIQFLFTTIDSTIKKVILNPVTENEVTFLFWKLCKLIDLQQIWLKESLLSRKLTNSWRTAPLLTLSASGDEQGHQA